MENVDSPDMRHRGFAGFKAWLDLMARIPDRVCEKLAGWQIFRATSLPKEDLWLD